MRASSIEVDSDYIDFLVQAGILELYPEDNKWHICIKVPLSTIIMSAIEHGFLNGNDDNDEINSIAFALAKTVLIERSLFYSNSEIMGVASVFRCIISELLYELRVMVMLNHSLGAIIADSEHI